MFFLQMLLQSPVTVDIDSKRDQISALNQFAPTFEHYSQGIIFVAGLLTFGYMIWGAVDWILSAGDSGKVESARKKITQAVVGLVILMSVAAVFLLLQFFLGIHILDGGAGKSDAKNDGSGIDNIDPGGKPPINRCEGIFCPGGVCDPNTGQCI